MSGPPGDCQLPASIIKFLELKLRNARVWRENIWYNYNVCGVRAQRINPELEPDRDSENGADRDTFPESKRHFTRNARKPIELVRICVTCVPVTQQRLEALERHIPSQWLVSIIVLYIIVLFQESPRFCSKKT